MTFDEYQKKALTTAAFHPDPLMDKTIWVLGIAGESSEVAEKWKKIVAYREGKITDDDKAELSKELGDIIWYIALLAHTLDLSFEEIANANLKKLADRKKRGVIAGTGDNR